MWCNRVIQVSLCYVSHLVAESQLRVKHMAGKVRVKAASVRHQTCYSTVDTVTEIALFLHNVQLTANCFVQLLAEEEKEDLQKQ